MTKRRMSKRRKRESSSRRVRHCHKKMSRMRGRKTVKSRKYRGGDKAHCAPSRSTSKIEDIVIKGKRESGGDSNETCYSSEELLKMRDEWNNMTKEEDRKIPSSASTSEIHRLLMEYMKGECKDDERCWLDSKFKNVKNIDEDKIFVPEAPESWKKNPTEWLSNFDIDEVMKQYEMKYKDFKYLGTTPIDFDEKDEMRGSSCVMESLCKFELKSWLDKGIRRFGVVFNTDKHTESGQHWISMFVDMDRKLVFFFDSTSDPAPPEVDRLIGRIVDQAKRQGITLTVEKNKVRHQYSNTECGMYSLMMIIVLLENGGDTSVFRTKKITDDQMKELRGRLFD